jgi:hypothetical protein
MDHFSKKKIPVYPKKCHVDLPGSGKFTEEEAAVFGDLMRGREDMRWRIVEEEARGYPLTPSNSPVRAFLWK